MTVGAQITRILVPTDFSPSAEAACDLAARLATRTQADLALFHALSGLELLAEVGRGRGKPQIEVLDDVRDRLRTWFETVVPAELRPSLTVGFHVKVSDPTPGIAWAAEQSKADLILMATYDVLLPSFVAGIISYQVSSSLGVTYFHHPIEFVPVFTHAFFLKVLVAGVFFGCCSVFLIEALRFGKKLSEVVTVWAPWKGVMGGGLLIALTLLFSQQYLGLGLNTIEASLEGHSIIWYAFILKAIFTSVTLTFGGSGGIVTPMFFIGATAGTAIAHLLSEDPATFAAIGLVSLLAGAANTPIAGSVLAVEYFGAKIAPYAAVACVVSFVMTGHRSVYPSQVLAIEKSPSLEVRIGEEIEKIEAQLKPGSTSVKVKIVRILKAVHARLSGKKDDR